MAIACLFILVAGCNEDNEPEEPKETKLRVVSVAPSGGNLPGWPDSRVTITVTFSRKVVSPTIMLNGTPVCASTANNKTYKVVINPISEEEYECMNAGDSVNLTLTIEATDEAGQSLEGFTPLEFMAVIPDFHPPTICGVKCVPRKGMLGVDPEEYTEKLIVAFNEPVTGIEVTSIRPMFDFTLNLMEDRSTLEIKFLDYTMPYETYFEIEISATDMAGLGSEDMQYWFTTMAKEAR